MNVAVFETSEIFGIAWNADSDGIPKRLHGKTAKATFERPAGKTHQVYSMGNLERAIEQGFKIYVASTREALGEHDAWWIELVGTDAIHLARRPDPEFYEEDRSAAAGAGWMSVYDALDLPWPTLGGVTDGTPAFWTVAREKLSKHGIKIGRDFEPQEKR